MSTVETVGGVGWGGGWGGVGWGGVGWDCADVHDLERGMLPAIYFEASQRWSPSVPTSSCKSGMSHVEDIEDPYRLNPHGKGVKTTKTCDLDQFRLDAPLELYLIPEYISEIEAASLISEINGRGNRWTVVSGRHLMNLGGAVHKKGLLPAPLPRWAAVLAARVTRDTGIFGIEANHILINCYAAGEGIMPHEDGPLYHPAVAIVSLLSPTVIRFVPKRPNGETLIKLAQ
jgi:hypothetical protein